MRVLVTGASGTIGQDFVAACSGGEFQLVRSDLEDRTPASKFPYRRLDVTDEAACRDACQDVDAVLHLAANPSPSADFRTSVVPLNMVGTYNLASAAVDAKVRQFVFASSVHAVDGYEADRQIREEDAPRPANDYGVGKAFGEALCASLAVRSSTGFVAVRIGHYAREAPPSQSLRHRARWLSPRDAHQLFKLALTRHTTGSIVAHGISNNAITRLAFKATTAALGYEPVDDAFR